MKRIIKIFNNFQIFFMGKIYFIHHKIILKTNMMGQNLYNLAVVTISNLLIKKFIKIVKILLKTFLLSLKIIKKNQ